MGEPCYPHPPYTVKQVWHCSTWENPATHTHPIQWSRCGTAPHGRTLLPTPSLYSEAGVALLHMENPATHTHPIQWSRCGTAPHGTTLLPTPSLYSEAGVALLHMGEPCYPHPPYTVKQVWHCSTWENPAIHTLPIQWSRCGTAPHGRTLLPTPTLYSEAGVALLHMGQPCYPHPPYTVKQVWHCSTWENPATHTHPIQWSRCGTAPHGRTLLPTPTLHL